MNIWHSRGGTLGAFRRFFPALVLCLSPTQALAATIYVTSTIDGLPSYSDSPIGPNSQVHMHISAPARRISGFDLPDRPERSVRLDAELLEIVRGAARLYELPEALLLAVIHVESGFNRRALSPKGAVGLMQIMPATGARYGVSADLGDPAKNIGVGARYLRDLFKMFKGDTELVLAAYNAGEGAVIRYRHTIPPFAETQAYVVKVLHRYAEYTRRG